MKILIVDDEPHLRMLIQQTLEELEEEGVELLLAANGEEALDTIRAERPQLVFLDVMMPKKNGFDVCHEVKQELGLSGTHIILLTAKGQEFDRRRGEEGLDPITRVTPDAVYIGHTREHVAGAPRYDPKLVEIELNYFFNLYPYYGYSPSFGLSPFMVVSPGDKSEDMNAKHTHR